MSENCEMTQAKQAESRGLNKSNQHGKKISPIIKYKLSPALVVITINIFLSRKVSKFYKINAKTQKSHRI